MSICIFHIFLYLFRSLNHYARFGSKPLFVISLINHSFLFSFFFFLALRVNATPQKIVLPERFKDRHGIDFLLLTDGSFRLKILEQERTFTLKSPVYLSSTEITQKQWQTVLKRNPELIPSFPESLGKGDEYPASLLSMEDIHKFLYILNFQDTPHRYRLPTKEEWEYALFFHFHHHNISLTSFPKEFSTCQKNPSFLLEKVQSSPPTYPGFFNLLSGVDEWITPSKDNNPLFLFQAQTIGNATLIWPDNCFLPVLKNYSYSYKNPLIGFRLVREVNSRALRFSDNPLRNERHQKGSSESDT